MFSQEQVLVASRAWLNAIRRSWVRRNPGKECWHPAWEELAVADRVMVMVAISAALTASDPANVARVMEQDNDQG